MIVAVGRHYGVTVMTCVPADPETKGGVERTVKVKAATDCHDIGLADLVIVLVKSFHTREALEVAAVAGSDPPAHLGTAALGNVLMGGDPSAIRHRMVEYGDGASVRQFEVDRDAA